MNTNNLISRCIGFILLAIISVFSYAQVPEKGATAEKAMQVRKTNTSYYVELNGVKMPLENLSIVDTVLSNGNIQHKASFELAINDNSETILLFSEFEQSIKSNKILKIDFVTEGIQRAKAKAGAASSNNSDVRTYNGAIVKKMSIPALDASARDAQHLQVDIEAESVQLTSKSSTTSKSQQNIKTAVSSNYRIVAGNLPTVSIRSVVGLVISGYQQNQSTVCLEMSADDAEEWATYFNTTGDRSLHGSPSIAEVVIELMGADFKKAVVSIYLRNLQFKSYSFNRNKPGEIARATMCLRFTVSSFSPANTK